MLDVNFFGLIREERVEEALEFAGSHLAERGEEDTQVPAPILVAAFQIRQN
jgi:hypothetical protein